MWMGLSERVALLLRGILMLTEKEYRHLLQFTDFIRERGFRDTTVLMLLRYYGLTGLANLRIGDTIKGDKKTIKWVKFYIKYNGLQNGEYLIWGRGKRDNSKPLKKHSILDIVQRLSKKHLGRKITLTDIHGLNLANPLE